MWCKRLHTVFEAQQQKLEPFFWQGKACIMIAC